jgi:hypothetical protein
MKLPGFNAESALGASSNNYRAPRTGSGSITDTATGVITPALQRAQSCETMYRAYISHYFPTTVCETVLPEFEVATMAAPAPSGGGQRSTTRTRGFRTDWLKRFQRCRTIAVPFIGEVRTTQNCNDAIPDSSVLDVYGHPELSTYWTGGINEIPPPYNAAWFGVVGHSCNCCGPFHKCPDGSCIPLNRSCTQYPV